MVRMILLGPEQDWDALIGHWGSFSAFFDPLGGHWGSSGGQILFIIPFERNFVHRILLGPQQDWDVQLVDQG